MKNQIILDEYLIETPGKPITGQITISSPFAFNDTTLDLETTLIQFSDYKTNDLFPPTVLTYHNEILKTIHVNAMVLLPLREIDPHKFQITQQYVFAENGGNQLNFYISYCSDEVSTNKYIPIAISFTSDPVFNTDGNSVEIGSTQTFFRNRDPKTSRGTVTTVKRPM